MRSARTLFASAAVTAVLAVSVPAAFAVTSADGWDQDSGSTSSSSSATTGNNDHREKPDSWTHEKPSGGMETGGGALAAISGDDWHKDDSGSATGNNADREKPESWTHEKPSGGMDTGGGALAGISADDWQKNDNGSATGDNAEREKPESWNQGEKSQGEKSQGEEDSADSGEESGSWSHEKPTGGVHTGGGAMALSGSSLAAGSALMLGGIGAGAYRLRRRNAGGGAAA